MQCLEVSGVVGPLWESLGVKWLTTWWWIELNVHGYLQKTRT